MVLDAESVIDRRRLKRRLTMWRIAAVVLGLLFIRRTGRKMDILEAGQVHGGMRRAYDRPEG